MHADKLEMQREAVERMRLAREMIFEVQDAWLALTAAAAQQTPFIDLQYDNPTWSVPGQKRIRHTTSGSPDSPAREGKSSSRALIDGPWV